MRVPPGNLSANVRRSLETTLRIVKGNEVTLRGGTDLLTDLELDSLDLAEVTMRIEKDFGLGVEHEIDQLVDDLIQNGWTTLDQVCVHLTAFLERLVTLRA